MNYFENRIQSKQLSCWQRQFKSQSNCGAIVFLRNKNNNNYNN